MDAFGIACTALFLPFLMLLALVALIGGGIGTALTRKDKKSRVIPLIVLLMGASLAICMAVNFIPDEFWLSLHPSYQLGDEKLRPYEDAISEIDRTSLGFSAITRDTEIKILDGDEAKIASCPDVELYISDLPIKKHHICIKRQGDKYVWDSEYEEYIGPKPWESIWIAYISRPGVLNQLGDPRGDSEPYTLVIEYWGSSDLRLENRTLTLEYIQPFLDEWKKYHEEQLEK